MPLEINPKFFLLRYALANIFAGLYAILPLCIVFSIAGIFIFNDITRILETIYLSTLLIVFSKRIFLNHIRINFMFNHYYHGKDKEKFKAWTIPTTLSEKYIKLPLPVFPSDNMIRRMQK